MLTWKTLIKYFGEGLFTKPFQDFLAENFNDLSEYNILDSDYICSDQKGLELGFTNPTAVFDDDSEIIFEKGNPIFSHFNMYPTSANFITEFPFNLDFGEPREMVLTKAGIPIKSREGYLEILDKNFLIDHYKIDNTIISIDYNITSQKIISLQLRDANISNVGV